MFGKKRVGVSDVFTIALPGLNYVMRTDVESTLRTAAERRDSIVCVSGPSKSGKTVLVRKVLPSLPVVTGKVDTALENLWLDLCRIRNISLRSVQSRLSNEKLNFGGRIAGAEASEALGTEQHTDADPRTKFLDHVENSGGVIIDDFHYFPAKVQKAVLQAFKDRIIDAKTRRKGISIVIVLTHFGQDQPALAEADVIGRVKYIRLPKWSEDQLSEILTSGFQKLNVSLPEGNAIELAKAAFGSPLIVQEMGASICQAEKILNYSRRKQILKRLDPSEVLRNSVLSGNIAGDANTFMTLIVGRTPTRDRVTYTINGQSGDVYFLIFYALKSMDLSGGIPHDKVMAWLRERMNPKPPLQGAQVDSALKGLTKTSLELVDEAQRNGRSREQPIDFQETTRTVTVNDPFLQIFIKYADWEADYVNRLGRGK